MEDRYLFKAKHFKKWHIGNIVKEPDGLYIRDIKGNVMAYINDESTICQCTGLKDKNGKLIWENDIVRVKYSDGFEEITEVAYSKNGYSPYLNEYECEDCCSYCEVTEIEIIGNIFDNPELLESEE